MKLPFGIQIERTVTVGQELVEQEDAAWRNRVAQVGQTVGHRQQRAGFRTDGASIQGRSARQVMRRGGAQEGAHLVGQLEAMCTGS